MREILNHIRAIETILEGYEPTGDLVALNLQRVANLLADVRRTVEAIVADEHEDEDPNDEDN